MSHALNTFHLTTTLPAAALADVPFVVVDVMDLEGATWGGVYGEQCAARLAAAGVTNPAEWQAIGDKHIDHSGWCDFENKMEYHHEVLVAMVRPADLAAARDAWSAAQAQPLTHNPFAVLAK